ncbi:type IV secretion system protein TraC [Vibrio sp. 10N.261.46.E12]|uniref:type IV secretion system protein TraC n=1 Tax=unclassified Vibrio TaxID=2614977 RepID=UPI000976D246|nr:MULTISPECIES: type IV secretion system protein TraC [unclassified Vibrio]OMO35728.1 type-IV secretion system protein TraC [Vibrio sp. 10N.261.45.E1]PMJ22888.1 type-IV secretion system protein TraC [Vibrio sp. 10N.286.45.B6]PML87211.1 type-IV secretion system protein TraC [Vibrio sp. 10N.261.49.E11]PMM67529.1 type-IV secretion system protein TraC [Vibrio sp. 10N.261.46.F12]PMM86710.1 type-IV secretion system protein TraC [Vibrio sp. 10N.261.46.E8]
MSVEPLFKAAHRLRETPVISDELPYHLFDEDKNVFINTSSVGMGLNFIPLSGVTDTEVETLNKLLCDLPEGDAWFYQVDLSVDNRVGVAIEQNAQAIQHQDGVHALFAGNEATYARYGARHSFDAKSSDQFNLRRYLGRIWVSNTKGDISQLMDVMETLTLGLQQLGLQPMPCTDESLLQAVRDSLYFDRDTLHDLHVDVLPFEPLASQVVKAGSELLVRDKSIACRFDGEQGQQDTVLVTLGLHKLPRQHHLFALPNCFAHIIESSKATTCPFTLSVAFTLQETGKTKIKNGQKIHSLTKWANSPMAKFLPHIVTELKDRELLQEGLTSDACKLSRCTFTVTLKTTEQDRKIDMMNAQNAFTFGGINLIPNHRVHFASLLNTLPFLPADGFFKDMEKLKLTRTVKTSNLVNFLPVVADKQRMSTGLLLPTFRRSLYYFDPFEAGGDNFNVAVAAASGSGKSFFTQALAKNQIERGGHVWILDNGDSYKKFTLLENGVYMSHKDIRLNPFTHLSTIAKDGDFVDDSGEMVNPLKQTIGDIVSLFAILCSPNQGVTDHQRTALLVAISLAWEHHGDKTIVDDVRDSLIALAKQEGDDRRILDLAFALKPYCQGEIYGEMFNEPSMLDPNAHLTTLELSGFKGDVLRPVVFALMVNINQAMYLSGDRTKPKMCIIEEAWKLMSGSDKAASEFIEEGYRTARKFRGSFVTITQGIVDFFKSSASEAAYNNSDVHVYLRQGDGFGTYVKDNPTAFDPFEVRQIKGFKTAKEAGYSSLMLRVGGRSSFHRFFCDPYTRALLSTESVEFTHVEKQLQQGVSITDAVIHTAKTFYEKDIARFDVIKAKEAEQAQGDAS